MRRCRGTLSSRVAVCGPEVEGSCAEHLAGQRFTILHLHHRRATSGSASRPQISEAGGASHPSREAAPVFRWSCRLHCAEFSMRRRLVAAVAPPVSPVRRPRHGPHRNRSQVQASCPRASSQLQPQSRLSHRSQAPVVSQESSKNARSCPGARVMAAHCGCVSAFSKQSQWPTPLIAARLPPRCLLVPPYRLGAGRAISQCPNLISESIQHLLSYTRSILR